MKQISAIGGEYNYPQERITREEYNYPQYSWERITRKEALAYLKLYVEQKIARQDVAWKRDQDARRELDELCDEVEFACNLRL